MTTQLLERTAATLDAAKSAVVADIAQSCGQQEPPAVYHLVLVSFNEEPPLPEFIAALGRIPNLLNGWLRSEHGLNIPEFAVDTAVIPSSKENFRGIVSISHRLMADGKMWWDGRTRWYLFSQGQPSDRHAVYGTIGGDYFGQKDSLHGGRCPGVSGFGRFGLEALAFSVSMDGEWTENKVMGAIGHEDGHALAAVPCVRTAYGEVPRPHGGIMTSAWGWWPNCRFQRDGATFKEEPPCWQRGDEIEEMLRSPLVERWP